MSQTAISQTATSQAALLEICGLKTYFHSGTETVKAVDDLTIRIQPGQTLGLVGESGSGKSMTGYSIMGL